jgi:stage V sporulation protein R
MRLFYYIEEQANKGRISMKFKMLSDALQRRDYDTKVGGGRDYIFKIRESMSDFLFVNTFVDQDFVDLHQLFVAGKRINEERGTWQYYVKSRKGEEYRQMVLDQLYHPPFITVKPQKESSVLYLDHHFEEKPLVREFIANTMIGIEYLWGGPVQLETSEVAAVTTRPGQDQQRGAPTFMSAQSTAEAAATIGWRRVLYTMKDRKLTKKTLT